MLRILQPVPMHVNSGIQTEADQVSSGNKLRHEKPAMPGNSRWRSDAQRLTTV